MNYDATKAHSELMQAASALIMGRTGEAIEIAKRAITSMENSLPPPVVYYGKVIEKET